MSGFRAVNTTLTVAEPPPRLEETTPTTPRPTKFTSSEESNADARSEDISMKTPTKDHFGGMAGQRALPAEPLTSVKIEDQTARNGVSRENSHRSTKSLGSVEDVEMRGGKEGRDGSDNESVQSDTRPSKKKKGQRFFCTDFPPCQLSFTRSEHLARHIRLGNLALSISIPPLTNTGNIPVNVLSNVIAPGDSHALTTFGNMRRRCTSTRTFPVIPSPQPERGSKGRSAPIAFDLQPAVRERQRWAVKGVTTAVTAEICPLLASLQSPRPQALVEKTSFIAQRHWPWLEIRLTEGT